MIEENNIQYANEEIDAFLKNLGLVSEGELLLRTVHSLVSGLPMQYNSFKEYDNAFNKAVKNGDFEGLVDFE